MLRMMAIFAGVAAMVYVGLCAYLFFFQQSLIYFPQPRSGGSSSATITLSTAGAQVLVTTRPHIGPSALLYFGGNAEDVSESLPTLSSAFPDHALYLMHYRGYGGSSGTPSEAALFADAIELFDKVHAEHERVAVVGRSLGSGIAVHLATVRPVSRLVLVTPYHSLQAVASHQYRYFPVRWLLRDKYESFRYAEHVTAPTLVVAAEHDEIIPRWSTDALYAHFREGVASLVIVANSGHNTISDSPEYIPLLRGTPTE
jgi:pimeloyl-ACP methyl ester carboxylesterase